MNIHGTIVRLASMQRDISLRLTAGERETLSDAEALLRKMNEPEEMQRLTCEWYRNGEGSFSTSCNRSFSYDSPHCPQCGKRVEIRKEGK